MTGVDWIAVAAAGGATALAGVVLAPVARRLGMVDVPGGRKGHARPTPLLGGAALLIGWGGGLLAGGAALEATALGAALAWMLGTADDIRSRGLSPSFKLLGQVAVVGIWTLATGRVGTEAVASVAIPLFAMNGFNLLDNTDGLCVTAGIGPAAGCAWLATVTGDSGPTLTLGTALAGALLGALVWNAPRARLFLGDGGSHLVGFLLGALVVEAGLGTGAGAAGVTLVAGLFLVLPILDTATVVIARARRGIPPWIGDRRHLSHRLHRLGWREGAALVLLGTVSAVGTGLGVWFAIAGRN